MNALRSAHGCGPSAWTLVFSKTEAADARPEPVLVCRIRYPVAATAYAEPIPLPIAGLCDPGGGFPAGGGFPVVLLAPGSGTPFELQRQADEWMTGPTLRGDVPPVCEVPLRGGRLRWRPDRAMAVAGADQILDAMAGIACFSWFSQQAASMEEVLDGEWPDLHADARFAGSHPANRRDRARLSERAVEMARRRQWFIGLTIALERPDSPQGAPARRIFLELAHQADMPTRLKLMDDAIEGAEDLYERIGERLTERAHFLQGLVVDIAILLAILAEIALFLWVES